MKREHLISKSNPLVDFLEEHNCIFYSPLTQTDTTDWISGNAMVKYANDSAVWDSSLNMWKFTYVNGQPYSDEQFYAKWTLNTPIPQGTDLNFTVISELYQYDTPVWSSVNTSPVYTFYPFRFGMSLSGRQGMMNLSAHQMETTNSGVYQKFFVNGVEIYNAYAYNTSTKFELFNEIGIGNMRGSNMRKMYGMRNFAAFLQVFSLEEINEYFSLL